MYASPFRINLFKNYPIASHCVAPKLLIQSKVRHYTQPLFLLCAIWENNNPICHTE